MVSALAITGMMFTTLLRCFMNSRSKGRRLQPKREQHGRGHFTLLAINPSDSSSIRASTKPPFYVPYLLPLCSHLLLPIHPALSQKTQWHFSCPCYPRLFQAPGRPQLSQTVSSPAGRTPGSMAEMKQSTVYICHRGTKGLSKGERLYVRVAGRGDEVEAAVHSRVWNSFLPCNIHLLFQKFFILLVDIFLNRFPAVKVGERDE